jgi:hypothetical protein
VGVCRPIPAPDLQSIFNPGNCLIKKMVVSSYSLPLSKAAIWEKLHPLETIQSAARTISEIEIYGLGPQEQ